MAAGQFIILDKALLNAVGAANLINPARTFKWTLHAAAMAPDPDTMEVFADFTSELAAGNGYTAGGIVLANPALSITAGVVKLTTDSAEFTATGGNIPAWRYGVIRVVGTFDGKVDPVLGYYLGDGTNVDVPATTVGNKIRFTPHASGLFTLSVV